jgi:hypothetical protein
MSTTNNYTVHVSRKIRLGIGEDITIGLTVNSTPTNDETVETQMNFDKVAIYDSVESFAEEIAEQYKAGTAAAIGEINKERRKK